MSTIENFSLKPKTRKGWIILISVIIAIILILVLLWKFKYLLL